MTADMIMDVMRAANAGNQRVAAQKLSAASSRSQVAASTGVFSRLADQLGISSSGKAMAKAQGNDLVAGVMAAADPARAQQAQLKLQSFGGNVAVADNAAPDAKAQAMQKLEGVLLNNMLDSMMPKGSKLYGEGTAGDVWRSFQVSEMADSMAQRGVLDLPSLDGSQAAPGKAKDPVALGQWPYFRSSPISSFAS